MVLASGESYTYTTSGLGLSLARGGRKALKFSQDFCVSFQNVLHVIRIVSVNKCRDTVYPSRNYGQMAD